MSAAPGSVLVVGGGVAGFATVRELRRRGHTGALTLVDPEGLPYDRPPLSKEYLTGETEPQRLLFAPPPWFAEHDVEVLARRVARLALPPTADAPRVVLDDGTERTAEAIVLATGGRPRRLAVPGGDHPDVLVLRTRADADRLATGLRLGARVVVIGAGFTGAEVASAARAALADVTLISASDAPAAAAVGPALAARLHAQHGECGVRSLTGQVTRIEHAGADDAAPHRVHVALADGSECALDADLVVAAIGIVPDTALAAAAGLALGPDGRILVDARRRTSHPAVHAVGDAAADGPGAMHWEAAMQDGADAAADLLGEEVPARGAGWFWSDRHDTHVEGAGTMTPPEGGRLIHREVRGQAVASFAVAPDGRLVGAASVDDPMAVKAARRLIDRGVAVDPARLADPAVPVKTLLRG